MNDEFGPNPFQPASGLPPPYLAGRLQQLEDFAHGLDEAARWNGSRSSQGQGASASTVMLDEAGRSPRSEVGV